MYEIIVALSGELSVTLLKHKYWPYLFAGLNTSEEAVIKIGHEVGEHFHHVSEKPWSNLGGLRRTGFVFLKWFLWNWKYLFRLYKLALQRWKSNKLDGASCAQMHQTCSFFFCCWGECGVDRHLNAGPLLLLFSQRMHCWAFKGSSFSACFSIQSNKTHGQGHDFQFLNIFKSFLFGYFILSSNSQKKLLCKQK